MTQPVSPERAEILSLRKGLDKAFASEAAVLASRYELLGKYKAARSQINIERSKTIAARAGCQSLAAKRDKFKLEAEGLREDISRIKAEREAAEEGYKQDIGALEAKVAELSSKLILDKPASVQGLRFELHRIIAQGGTRPEILRRIKELRDRLGGDPSGEPGWTP